jgi:hypothetical protein
VNVGTTLTQTLATATIAGVIALPATNRDFSVPVTAFANFYTVPTTPQPDDVFSSITALSSVPLSPSPAQEIEVSQSDSRWQRYVSERIEEIRSGSDDYSELPRPSLDVVERAWWVVTRTLRAETPTPSVVPSDEGSIVFVWHKALWDLEIEVGPKETTVWAHNRKTDTMFSGPLDEQRPKLLRLLSYLAWH